MLRAMTSMPKHLTAMMLCLLAAFALLGCGEYDSAATHHNNAAVFMLDWSAVDSDEAKHVARAATIDCAGLGIAAIRAIVYNTENANLVKS